MKLYFNSTDIRHKNPYGALKTETKTYFCVKKESGDKDFDFYINYKYGLKSFTSGKARLEPEENSDFFSCSLVMPDEPCLFFYWFEAVSENEVFYYVRNTSENNGAGEISHTKPLVSTTDTNNVFPFQITVYNKHFKTPDWLKGAVIYQIFPDRFRRDKDFSLENMKGARDLPERIYHEEWEEDVDYKGKPQTGYMACDFFGGSLNGIREKLRYLNELCVDAIYLNPVFESRSNHRYDTGNYEKIDPMLGSEDSFKALCNEGRELSIKIILDGVFSHTGADSVYFNKYGRYKSNGAYQDAAGEVKSPYFSWYDFHIKHGNITYDSWWGFPDLPNVNENDLLFREYILGKNGIIEKWLDMGASGWRLDVSDEIPDSFLRKIRKTVKSKNPDAVIMGEVWEDASHKISYGGFRDFLFGNTHDNVMGYPFCNNVLAWLRGDISGSDMVNSLERIRENYPPESFYCNMTLISSHDIPRAITSLAGKRGLDNRSEQAITKLSEKERETGKRLMKLAVAMQLFTPGAPSIYYGDELAFEGYRDPFNRRTFNWRKFEGEDGSFFDWIKSALNFRKENQIFRSGYISYDKQNENLIVFRRYLVNSKDAFGKPCEGKNEIYIVLNRSDYAVNEEINGINHNIGAISGLVISNSEVIFKIV